ncbi:MAG: hypothetical protein ACK46G_15255 [Flavobacteriales bacterium]
MVPQRKKPVRNHVLVVLLGLMCAPLWAQRGVTTFGIQLKPVLPLEFFDPLTTLERPSLSGTVELTGGMAFSMSVRIGISDMFSLETGLGQISRRYNFGITNDTSGYSEGSDIRFIGYELPLAGLVYIRLGEQLWMNTALGGCLDFYPSDVQRDVQEGRAYFYRYNWAQFAVLANLGVEHRTRKSGMFYLGATYHRTFSPIAVAELTYYGPNFFPYNMRADLIGTYLTVDLRYYFHEDPDKTKLRKKKS